MSYHNDQPIALNIMTPMVERPRREHRKDDRERHNKRRDPRNNFDRKPKHFKGWEDSDE